MSRVSLGEKEKVVLLITAGVVLLMLIFPPFVVRLPSGSYLDKGYGFIFSPPKHGYLSATINVATLLTQLAGVALIAGVIWMFVGGTQAASFQLRIQNHQNPLDSTKTLANPIKSAPRGTTGGTPKILRAGFWRRTAAFMLDYLIVFLGLFVAFAFLGAITRGFSRESAESLGALVGVLVYWLYFVNSESGPRQATIGKRTLSIKVVGFDGKRISFGKASGRHFAKILSSLTMGIGFVMCVFTKRKQCLHDMASNCLVIRDYATEQEIQAVIAATA